MPRNVLEPLQISETPPAPNAYDGSTGATMAQSGFRVDGLWFIYKDGVCVADFQMDTSRSGLLSLHVHVDRAHQRQGIASALYDWAEARASESGRLLAPAEHQTSDARQFWQARFQRKLERRREASLARYCITAPSFHALQRSDC